MNYTAITFDQILELVKIAVIPLLVWIAKYMQDISKSLVSLKNDINDIKTNLATAALKHDDLKSDVEEIKKSVNSHSESISDMKVSIAKVERIFKP